MGDEKRVKVIEVINGNTFKGIDEPDKFFEYRLTGLDNIELCRNPYYESAKRKLESLIGGATITVTVDEHALGDYQIVVSATLGDKNIIGCMQEVIKQKTTSAKVRHKSDDQ